MATVVPLVTSMIPSAKLPLVAAWNPRFFLERRQFATVLVSWTAFGARDPCPMRASPHIHSPNRASRCPRKGRCSVPIGRRRELLSDQFDGHAHRNSGGDCGQQDLAARLVRPFIAVLQSRNHFVADDRRERRALDDRKKFYEQAIACIRGAESLLILGPGEAKGEFSKHIKAKKLRGIVVELETADKMTDRQLAAKVKQYFAKSSAKTPVVQKKTAKAITKATERERPQNSAKGRLE